MEYSLLHFVKKTHWLETEGRDRGRKEKAIFRETEKEREREREREREDRK